jgi:hypothetical protein
VEDLCNPRRTLTDVLVLRCVVESRELRGSAAPPSLKWAAMLLRLHLRLHDGARSQPIGTVRASIDDWINPTLVSHDCENGTTMRLIERIGSGSFILLRISWQPLEEACHDQSHAHALRVKYDVLSASGTCSACRCCDIATSFLHVFYCRRFCFFALSRLTCVLQIHSFCMTITSTNHLNPAKRRSWTSVRALLPLKNATKPTTPAAGSVWNRFQLV